MDRKEFIEYIFETYGVQDEYPWKSAPSYAVFRHKDNRKWFAVIMNISKDKLGLPDRESADVVNLKCDPILIGSLRNEKGIFPAYHMSKTKWISVLIDGGVDDDKLKWLLDISFDLTAQKQKKKNAMNK